MIDRHPFRLWGCGFAVIRVVELFAGVGGFRLGFDAANDHEKNEQFRVIWSNQWEPSTKTQHASDSYCKAWNLSRIEETNTYSDQLSTEFHVNEDIATITASEIPDHDLLVGGFPCQDYSVARTLKNSTGINGKKGVLWWEIYRILEEKRPTLVLLENVDRLLKSPTKQRGRDFAVMLAALSKLDYNVEWRVITASDYGMPQRRKRVFIFATKKTTPFGKEMMAVNHPIDWISSKGIFAKAFPTKKISRQASLIPESPFEPLHNSKQIDLHEISENFNLGMKESPFNNAGMVIDGKFFSCKVETDFRGKQQTLGDVLLPSHEIDEEFLIKTEDLIREKGWIYLKGAKKEERRGTGEFTYNYAEGPVTFPDALDRPSRTIITGEGGAGASRFKHVVRFEMTNEQRENKNDDLSEHVAVVRKQLSLGQNEWVRRLHPIELERLNMMPDGHTAGHTASKRAFLMGNALVVGTITKIAIEIGARLQS
jgi:DNA (cytosine-5)-methyltransferase 1